MQPSPSMAWSPSQLGLKPMHQQFGGRGTAPAAGLQAPVSNREAPTGTTKPWDPQSPLFWFGAIAAATFGLIGATFSAHLGPFRGTVSAGS